MMNQRMYSNFLFKIIIQSQTGKANAVWEALEVVENEVVAILDADPDSVEPETLLILDNEKNSAIVNGTREACLTKWIKKSMRFLNKMSNRFFQYFIMIFL